MGDDPVYYQPPAEHDAHIRGMIKFLVGFFAVLIVAVVAVVLSAQSLARMLPFSAEKRFAEGIERTITALVDDTRGAESRRIENYLQSLADELAVNMEVPDEYEISVHFLGSKEVNAFATLGGHVFVLGGLVETMPDENSLAMVLAHEIAHIKHRDPLAGLGRGVALQIIYSFLTGEYSRSPDIAAYGGNIGLMFFSREQEQSADLAAIQGLQSTYGHVAGSETLFRVLAENQNTGETTFPAWLSTHPRHELRIETLRAHAEERGWGRESPRPYPPEILAALEAIESGTTMP